MLVVVPHRPLVRCFHQKVVREAQMLVVVDCGPEETDHLQELRTGLCQRRRSSLCQPTVLEQTMHSVRHASCMGRIVVWDPFTVAMLNLQEEVC